MKDKQTENVNLSNNGLLPRPDEQGLERQKMDGAGRGAKAARSLGFGESNKKQTKESASFFAFGAAAATVWGCFGAIRNL